MEVKYGLYTRAKSLFGLVVDDAISYKICDELIEISRPILQKSTTLLPKIEGYRTSSNCFLQYSERKPAKYIADIVSEITKYPLENFEAMQVLKYEEGEVYKKHRDSFNKEDYETEFNRGGQRVWTSYTYLNDVESGGETLFTEIGAKIKPKKSRMVIWMNYFDGKIIEDSMHEALPTIGCEKWGATVWVRENKFT